HGILSLIICLAGCLANIVNIVVLSRRELRRNAINRILCSLAVADFLLMLEYIPFACHMYLFPGRSLQTRYSYPWAVFVLFHAHFTLVAHTVSIWLTLSLAFWRYEVLKNGRHQRRKNGRRCHQRCTRTIAMAYIGSVLLCIPSFITFGIQSEPIKNTNFTINHTQLPTASSWSSSSTPLQLPEAVIYKAHLWAYSVVMKLGPCLVLTVLTCWLVRRLWEAERHHQSLTANGQIRQTELVIPARNRRKLSHQTDRTTRMLVAVLVLFLVTEIPQGVMALLSGVLGRQFFIKCYSTGMGEILDLLALLNSAINFLLYCSMSRQFR
ncbi:putative neuropeptide G protein-coupled receptor, partial [Daphnia pulex]